FDLTSQRWGVLLHHNILMMLEPYRFKRLPHAPRMANAAPYLTNLNLPIGHHRLVGVLRTTSPMPDECPSHGSSPSSREPANDSQCSRLRCRARARYHRPW